MLRITNVTNDALVYCRAIYICKYIADFLLKKTCFLIFIYRVICGFRHRLFVRQTLC